MDVQGRAPQPGMRPDVGPPPDRPQQYANPQTNRPSVDGITPPPVFNSSPTNTQPAPPPVNTDQLPPEVKPVLEQPQVLEPTHHRSSKPVVLAIITLLIAGALGVTAFFVFRTEKTEKVNKVNTPTTSENKSANSTTTTNAQIESATTEINEQVDGLNDTQDFADSELSDQTLGL